MPSRAKPLTLLAGDGRGHTGSGIVQPSNAEWPPDLGYWIGYRIAKSYYDQAQDKQQAILDILALTDFEAFVRGSRYAEQVER